MTGGLDPALSPDGTQIAFVRDDKLMVIRTDGTGEQALFSERPGLRSPKWSPTVSGSLQPLGWQLYCRDLGFMGLCPAERQLIPEPARPGPDATQEEMDAYDRAHGFRADVIKNFDRVTKPNFMLARVDTDGKEYRDLAALNSAQTPDWGSAGIVYQSTEGYKRQPIPATPRPAGSY